MAEIVAISAWIEDIQKGVGTVAQAADAIHDDSRIMGEALERAVKKMNEAIGKN